MDTIKGDLAGTTSSLMELALLAFSDLRPPQVAEKLTEQPALAEK